MGRTQCNDKTMVIFCADQFKSGAPYPNCAVLDAEPFTPEWREFSINFPFSEPVHFYEYLNEDRVKYSVESTEDAPDGSVYPISLSFFDFTVEWFDIIPKSVVDRLVENRLKIWFLYSEGDNPFRIKKHIEKQMVTAGISIENLHFTTANTKSHDLAQFSYLCDDELLYRRRNEGLATEYHERPRSKNFTALVRTHKWWRANTMTRLWMKGLHEKGFFSYNNNIDVGDLLDNNPISVDVFGSLKHHTEFFLKLCPFHADLLSSDEHNLYHHTVAAHHDDAYFNFVIETHLDVDQSDGVFLTEKTFKPIKHAQPFVIVGAAGSIQQLRDMGYKTFDHVVDHSYDTIVDSTERWDVVCTEMERIAKHKKIHQLYVDCKEDLLHNQQLFLASKANRLETILGKLK
jgi:hypothetical protein